MELQIETRFLKFPIEGRGNKIEALITPLDEEASKGKILAKISYYYQGIGEPYFQDDKWEDVDLRKGAQRISIEIRPEAIQSVIRVYIQGLADDAKIFDKVKMNHISTTKIETKRVPEGTRYLTNNVKVFSWLELSLFVLASVSTIGAICEIIGLFRHWNS